VVLSLEADAREEVTIGEIEQRAAVSRAFARKLAHTLAQKGWLQRVGQGRYLVNPARHGPDSIADSDPLRLGAHLVAPYYFGYATAAELLGLLPQASRTYYIVSPVRSGFRAVHAAQFRLVHVRPASFFGMEPLTRRGEQLTISDPERTVLDCLQRPEFSGGLGGVVRILESAGRRLRWGRLEAYLERLGQRSLALRLGFLAEKVELRPAPPRRWVDRARARRSEPYVPLGPPKEFGRRGPRDERWHVIGNVPDSLLLAEVDLR